MNLRTGCAGREQHLQRVDTTMTSQTRTAFVCAAAGPGAPVEVVLTVEEMTLDGIDYCFGMCL